jgi:Na+/H+ antiporter NhaC
VLLCFIGVALFTPQLEDGASYGIWTMLPPVCIFAFILLTKKILEGFFWTSLLAVFMRFRWNILQGFIDQIFENVTNWDNWWVIYLFLLGGAITYLFKISGAGTFFARWIAKRIKSKKAALFITSLLGWPLCVDDYMSGWCWATYVAAADEYGGAA